MTHANGHSRPLSGILIGAGQRGFDAYASCLLRDSALGRIVAVADPNEARRGVVARAFAIASRDCHTDHRSLLEGPKIADFAIIATPDSEHLEPALRAMEKGYAVLLEKPMAVTPAACEALVQAAERCGTLLQICHVLRYAPLYTAMKAVIDSGEIGDIVTIQHSENVSYWHYAHSYVRGSWRNRSTSSPMILAKSCHDLDLLYWLAGAPPRRLTSLERPTELCAKNAPEGAPEFCIEGCRHSAICSYDAVAMYRDATPLLLDVAKKSRHAAEPKEPAAQLRRTLPVAEEWKTWPTSVITDEPGPEGIDRALRTGDYGRCVYKIGDNDQPSSQVVNVEFENGVNASFTMHSTSHREGRETRIDGTRGTLRAGFFTLEQFLEVSDHKTGACRSVDLEVGQGLHGGSDPRLFASFLAAVRGQIPAETTAAESLWSHRMAFAAERAARESLVIDWT